MKLAFACAAATFALATAVAGATSAEAPADEYFGPLRMSAIGIRMRVDELGRRYHARTIADVDLLHDAGDAETSLRAWRDKYPRDLWLAPAAFHLEQLYQAVQTPEARERATAMLHYVETNFSASPYARLCRMRLAQGFPPLHGESPVRPTPAPYGGSPAPASSPDPGAGGTPASPAAPSPSASATSPARVKFPKVANRDTKKIE